MRRVKVLLHNRHVGYLERLEDSSYRFCYLPAYDGPSISLQLPTEQTAYAFDAFPPFFDGLLPEGMQLEALLRQNKIDKTDYLTQLLAVGGDLVGAVTVKPA